MKRHYATLLFFSFFQIFGVWSQDVQIFKVEDFDLKGKVKSCLVITDYGREFFEFNEEGILTKTITQYNDSDQDITDYRYSNGELLEKRMESYKNNVLDESTSMANFYTVDTVPTRKVVEKIISYDKQFLEKEEYQYNEDGKLVRIISSNTDGVDETTFEYTPYKNELTISTFTNGILEKSVRTSERKGPKGTQKVVLTKEYLDGEPNTAVEEVYGPEGKLLTQEDFLYDVGEKEFVSQKKLFYHYKDGVLQKVVTKTLNTEAVDEYIFQFDSHTPKNWVKKIITPDNTYTTRVIKYYPEEETPKEKTDH
ncbi:hypothetical protein [Flagellimonas pelagia]|uniref:YD repeat-containing protein n=1 Tax=Flagellimonas pelagia TaxID=2306998 RepID=A0A3A1NNR3_9FLAO|nr:hypothetical protein [Allomuricauda maritima]RIV45961.1 hypothetical protein D2V05_05135 [Allomuricauda maritima]TXJ98724.1 hypothetical protein FQ017_05100 [Allomuricauda maritima]